MKTRGTTKIDTETSSSEDMARKSLHFLQPAATDKENLVGPGRMVKTTQPSKNLDKKKVIEKPKKDALTHKKINHKDKAVQTARGEKIKIEVEDLTSEAGPSENYWEVLAERRRIALEDALEENRMLIEENKKLIEENRLSKEMLDETKALVEVLQEIIGEDTNGINNSLDDSVL